MATARCSPSAAERSPKLKKKILASIKSRPEIYVESPARKKQGPIWGTEDVAGLAAAQALERIGGIVKALDMGHLSRARRDHHTSEQAPWCPTFRKTKPKTPNLALWSDIKQGMSGRWTGLAMWGPPKALIGSTEGNHEDLP